MPTIHSSALLAQLISCSFLAFPLSVSVMSKLPLLFSISIL